MRKRAIMQKAKGDYMFQAKMMKLAVYNDKRQDVVSEQQNVASEQHLAVPPGTCRMDSVVNENERKEND